MRQIIDLTGKIFGNLTVLSMVERNKGIKLNGIAGVAVEKNQIFWAAHLEMGKIAVDV